MTASFELPRLEEVLAQTLLEERVDPFAEFREARRAVHNIKDKFGARRARRRVALVARRVELLAP